MKTSRAIVSCLPLAPILLSVLLLFGGCKPRELRPPKFGKIREGSQKCRHNGHLSKQTLRQRYPFSHAASVEVISFKGVPEYDFGAIVGQPEPPKQLPDTFERVVLTPAQTDAVADVMYNYNFSKRNGIYSEDMTGCYFPRQSILWKNQEGKIMEWLEICFECGGHRSSLPDGSYGVFCEGKYARFKALFVGLGITYFED